MCLVAPWATLPMVTKKKTRHTLVTSHLCDIIRITIRIPKPFVSRWRQLTQVCKLKKLKKKDIIRMEILIYRRHGVDYGERNETNCLVPQFTCHVVGHSEIYARRISRERSRTASPGVVLQRASIMPAPNDQTKRHLVWSIWRKEPSC